MSSTLIGTVFFDLGDTLVVTPAAWVPGAQTAIATLRAAGVRLGIISNTGNRTRAQVRQLLPTDFNLSDFVSELVILSSEVGHEKPSKEIFELAVTRAAVAANTCLFCTETLLDTLAAQQVGMRAARLLATAGDLNALPTHLRDAGLLP